jgi:uracil-DNA glycosylase
MWTGKNMYLNSKIERIQPCNTHTRSYFSGNFAGPRPGREPPANARIFIVTAGESFTGA